MLTALVATVGAAFSCMDGATPANASRYTNIAAIKKTEATIRWNDHQAMITP